MDSKPERLALDERASRRYRQPYFSDESILANSQNISTETFIVARVWKGREAVAGEN